MVKNNQTEILELLEQEVEQAPFSKYFFENRVEKYFLVISGIAFLCMIPLLAIESLKAFGYVAGALFILGVLFYLVAQAIGALILFRSPLRGYVKRLKKRLPAQSGFIEKLAYHEPEVLRDTAVIIASDVERLSRRVSLLIGVVEKVGIVPAGLALYYATYKHFYTEQGGNLPDFVLAFVCGLYVGAFISHKLIESLRIRIGWLQKAAEIAETRRKLKVA